MLVEYICRKMLVARNDADSRYAASNPSRKAKL